MKKTRLWILLAFLPFILCGCSSLARKNESMQEMQKNNQDEENEIIKIAESYRGIYEQAATDETLGQLDTVKAIMKSIGDSGYAVADIENQVDMVNPDQIEQFAQMVEQKREAEVMLICVMEEGGFIGYALQTAEGRVNVVRNTLIWKKGMPEITDKEEYPAHTWEYSQGGYLFFEQSLPSGYDGPSGHTAIRVAKLDEKCREWNRMYIIPIGYDLNNMFISDWDESDYRELNFYDLYETLHQMKYGGPFPYEPQYAGETYAIAKTEFETVLQTYFQLDRRSLQERSTYDPGSKAYQYRPRGMYDFTPSPHIPYPEVVAYQSNPDGTITLTVNGVWPEENLDRAFCHEVVIRPLAGDGFQYVSNHVVLMAEGIEPIWYRERLSDERWEEYYGGQSDETATAQ